MDACIPVKVSVDLQDVMLKPRLWFAMCLYDSQVLQINNIHVSVCVSVSVI